MKKTFEIVKYFILLAHICEIRCRGPIINTVEDGLLNFTALANKYVKRNLPVEEYDVLTEDGYVLKLFHIPGDSKWPVLMMHGIIDSADTFVIRGEGSLAVALADRGYDVWAGTSRGSKYSRRHVTLNPDRDKKFWDFSFHEIGYYDLPAVIDFILDKTGRPRLSAIGHSQGNTIFYVLGSTKPEYNIKINVIIALAPVCFLNFPEPPLTALLALGPLLNNILKSLGQEEILGEKSLLTLAMKKICNQKNIGYVICAHGIFFLIAGSDPGELEPEFLPVVVAHYPTSTSRKNAFHLVQMANSKTFSQYDYGPSQNLYQYQSVRPTKYDLSKVTMRVAMLFGENDGIASLKDVSLMRETLPNVVDYRLLKYKRFNHMDAVWGLNMKTYLFPSIYEILEKYYEQMI